MSKEWGYVCRSHDPELPSDQWINHGEDILADVARTYRQGLWPNNDQWGQPVGFYHDGIAWTAPITWLQQHPRCDIALRSEYGDTEEITRGESPTPTSQPELGLGTAPTPDEEQP